MTRTPPLSTTPDRSNSLTDLAALVRKSVPSVPKALNALAAMERELNLAKTYDDIRKIERTAEALKILFADVDQVRQQAETVIVLAKARIGEEIEAVPKANKHQSPKRGKLTHGRGALGIPHTSRSRLKKLGRIPPQELKAITKQIHESGGDATVSAVLKTVAAVEAAEPEKQAKAQSGTWITLQTYDGRDVPYRLPAGKATFNRTNEHVDWAAWTWNVVTGCLHPCRYYCYADELANRPSYKDTYPARFTPLFHHERLDAPANTKVPEEAKQDPRLKRVFVVSMGDLYGKWVPDEWIEQVLASCTKNPQWDYLFLTKDPHRYAEFQFPPTAWLGTTVDEQKRVHVAEEAFRQIKDVRVKWLSLEPLLEPLEFSDLSMFNWIVIGSKTATRHPDGHGGFTLEPEFAPPFKWVARLVAQAEEAGCRVYLKPNLQGIPNPQSPGMQLPQEEPAGADEVARAGDAGA